MENLQAEEAVTIVRKIVASRVAPQKISFKKLKGYIAILFEDDRYRTICRLYMNNDRRKYIGVLSRNKVETRNRIENMSDILKHSKDISDVVASYSS